MAARAGAVAERQASRTTVYTRPTPNRGSDSASAADGMCVERVAIGLSSVPDGAYAATQLAEERLVVKSVGRIGITPLGKANTTVVLMHS